MQKTSDTTNWKIIEKMESDDLALLQRLNEMGFEEGLPINMVRTVSFGSVYIVQIDESIIALNSTEMQCLKLRSMSL